MTTARAVAIVLNSKNATGPVTFSEAKGLLEREAAAGAPLQQYVIGVTTDDKAKAAKYLAASRDKIRLMAEKKDNPLAWYLLSMESNDLKLLRRAADGGNVQALNALGTIVTTEAFSRNLSSNALERVLCNGYEYFRRAAAQNDPNGFINLGTCYLQGMGCPLDMTMAFACFKAAADAGHPEGMDNMSMCYRQGFGVRRNEEQSLYWKIRGRAARGDESAAAWLRDRK